MKNAIKLLGAGLIIMTSQAFAQSPASVDNHLATTSAQSAGLQDITTDHPTAYTSRREFRAQGLSKQQIRRAHHAEVQARKAARHERRMAHHSQQVQHHDVRRQHHAQAAENHANPNEANVHRQQVRSNKTAHKR
ncbi:MAG: hypothetical protein ABIO46_03635 [Chitinophagales bacterium]